MTQGKAFKPNVLIIESARSSIDIATGYKTECYFSEDNTTALTEYEIARRLQIHVSSVNHHFDICSIQEDCKEEFIKNKIKISIQGKPVFLTVSSNQHIVAVAILPDPKTPNLLHVIYTNSATNTTSRELEGCRNTGREFIAKLVKQINTTNIDGHKLDCKQHEVKITPTQQIENNSGPMTAFNHATTAVYWEGQKDANKAIDGHALTRYQQERELCNRVAQITDNKQRSEEFEGIVKIKFQCMSDLLESEVPVQHDMRKDYTKDIKRMVAGDNIPKQSNNVYKPASRTEREGISQHH